jgi:hypothetical protein
VKDDDHDERSGRKSSLESEMSGYCDRLTERDESLERYEQEAKAFRPWMFNRQNQTRKRERAPKITELDRPFWLIKSDKNIAFPSLEMHKKGDRGRNREKKRSGRSRRV